MQELYTGKEVIRVWLHMGGEELERLMWLVRLLVP